MGHLQTFEAQLRERLARGVSEETILWIKEQVYQSYRNGMSLKRAAGEDGERVDKIARRTYKR